METLSAVSNLLQKKSIENSAITYKDLTNKCILYIDDDYVNYLYFSELLARTGASILRAYSLDEALAWISGEYKLCLVIISGSFASRMDYKLVSQIKKIAPNLPIIGILSNNNHEGIHRFLEDGCDLYLNRHIDDIQLIEMINELFENSYK